MSMETFCRKEALKILGMACPCDKCLDYGAERRQAIMWGETPEGMTEENARAWQSILCGED